jgi:hypothetical protein
MHDQRPADPLGTIEISRLPSVAGGAVSSSHCLPPPCHPPAAPPPCLPVATRPPYHPGAPDPLPWRSAEPGFFGYGSYGNHGFPGYGGRPAGR